MVTNVSQTEAFTVDQLLSRSRERAMNGVGESKIQQMLAGRDNLEDRVELSPVQKAMQRREAQAPKKESYFESDDYIRLKVGQLRGQIALYSNLPGLDASGAVMDSLTKEVNELLAKQQAKLKESQDEMAAKEAELQAKQAELASAPLSAEQLLSNAKTRAAGGRVQGELSTEAQALLDKVRGKSVNTSA